MTDRRMTYFTVNTTTKSEDQMSKDEEDRRRTLRNVIARTSTAVELVELVDELGLEAELEELVGDNQLRRINLERARIRQRAAAFNATLESGTDG